MMDIFQSELIQRIEAQPLSCVSSDSDDNEVHELVSNHSSMLPSSYMRGVSSYSVVYSEKVADEESIAPNMSSIEKGWRSGYQVTEEMELEIQKKNSVG